MFRLLTFEIHLSNIYTMYVGRARQHKMDRIPLRTKKHYYTNIRYCVGDKLNDTYISGQPRLAIYQNGQTITMVTSLSALPNVFLSWFVPLHLDHRYKRLLVSNNSVERFGICASPAWNPRRVFSCYSFVKLSGRFAPVVERSLFYSYESFVGQSSSSAASLDWRRCFVFACWVCVRRVVMKAIASGDEKKYRHVYPKKSTPNLLCSYCGHVEGVQWWRGYRWHCQSFKANFLRCLDRVFAELHVFPCSSDFVLYQFVTWCPPLMCFLNFIRDSSIVSYTLSVHVANRLPSTNDHHLTYSTVLR